MPLSDDAQERALAALQQWQAHPVQVDLDVLQLTMLIGALQLALRHPHFPATSRRFVTHWLGLMIATVGGLDEDLEALLRAGNDPAQDVPTAAHQERTRQWCRVQRGRVAQQRRAREEDA